MPRRSVHLFEASVMPSTSSKLARRSSSLLRTPHRRRRLGRPPRRPRPPAACRTRARPARCRHRRCCAMLAEAWPSASAFFSMASLSSPLSAARRSDTALSTLARSPASTLSPRSLQRLLHRVDQRVGLVARLDQLAEALVFLGVRLGIAHHALDLFLVQAARGLDDDLLLLAGGLVLGRHVAGCRWRRCRRTPRPAACRAAPAGCRVRSNLPSDLLSAARSRSPCSTWMVTAVWLSSAVENTLRRLGRDGGVLLDELGHDAAERLDAERQRRHVEQQHVLDLARRARRPGSPRPRRPPHPGSRPCAAPCRRSPSRTSAPAACGSGRRPGSPRRCRSG